MAVTCDRKGFLDIISSFMMMFQSEFEWMAIAQYNLSLVLFLCDKFSEAMKVQ